MLNRGKVLLTCALFAGTSMVPAWGADSQNGTGQSAKNPPQARQSQDQQDQAQQGDKRQQNTNRSSDEHSSSDNSEATSYLGVVVEPMHQGMHSHLPESLQKGQGVMVARVSSGSPADHAGLKAHDIIAKYDDQRIFSPEQMVRLVQADQPGKQVSLQVIRGGKPKTLTATLGKEPDEVRAHNQAAEQQFWEENFSWNPSQHHHQQHSASRQQTYQDNDENYSFDSLLLKRTDKGKNEFKAEINYLDKDGKKQHHEFTGTREEIAKQIREEKDLPDQERQQLLSGVEVHQGGGAMGPDLWIMVPDGY